MNTGINKSIVLAALGIVTVGSANADPITGSISFTGGITLNNADFSLVDRVSMWTSATGPGSPTVLSDSGSFAAFIAPGTAVSFNAPWMLNNTTGINNFWSVGGFVFNLISSQITSDAPGTGIQVTGVGTITGPAGSGLTATPGVLSFSVPDSITGDSLGSPIFTFQGETDMPDGGTTLILLGASLSGMALIRWKQAA
jgi:hypothetical protein